MTLSDRFGQVPSAIIFSASFLAASLLPAVEITAPALTTGRPAPGTSRLVTTTYPMLQTLTTSVP